MAKECSDKERIMMNPTREMGRRELVSARLHGKQGKGIKKKKKSKKGSGKEVGKEDDFGPGSGAVASSSHGHG